MTKWSSEIKEAIKLHVLLSFYVKTSQLRTVALLLLLLETQVQLQTDKMHAIATVLFVHCFVFVCLLVCIWFSGETWSLRTKTFIFHEINNFTWKHALHCTALHRILSVQCRWRTNLSFYARARLIRIVQFRLFLCAVLIMFRLRKCACSITRIERATTKKSSNLKIKQFHSMIL